MGQRYCSDVGFFWLTAVNLVDDSWLDEALSLPTVQKLRRLRKTLKPPRSWLYKK